MAAKANGVILFSNLGQAINGTEGISVQAQRFATDFLTAGSATTLTNLTITLQSFTTNSLSLTLSILPDVAGLPGSTSIGTFNPISVPSTQNPAADFSTTTTGISLSANTNYWLVAQINQDIPSGTGAFYLTFTRTSQTDTGSIFSPVTTTTQESSGNNGVTWNQVLPSPYEMRYSLSGTVVPEPTGAMLILIGLFTVATQRRMKAKRC